MVWLLMVQQKSREVVVEVCYYCFVFNSQNHVLLLTLNMGRQR